MSLNKTSLSAMMAAHIAAVTAHPRPRYEPLPAHAFPAPSLSAWLEIARAAGVPVVPSEEVAHLPLADLLAFEDNTPASIAALDQLRALHDALEPGTMLRWDCCAPLGIKEHMAAGQSACPDDGHARELHPGDPRAFDILFSHPAETVAVHRRPWVSAATHEGFPVEFRVFVHEGTVRAVSNYYVQRALPATPEVLAQARAAATLVGRMVDEARRAGRFPWMEGQTQDPASAQPPFEATLDVLITPSGEALFLEAGPGFGFGAHPCCFYNPAQKAVQPLNGILLGVGGTVHPLHPEEAGHA